MKIRIKRTHNRTKRYVIKDDISIAKRLIIQKRICCSYHRYIKKDCYVGIKNECCYICFSSANAKVNPRDHFCYLNYNRNSKSMETNILAEGFFFK